MSALSNPLLESGLSQFDGTVNLDALAGFNDPSFNDQNGDGVPDHYNQELAPLHTNHRGYIGDDGALYRKEVSISPEGEVSREYTDERLYFWTPPQELGRAPNDPDAQEQAMAGPKGFGAAGLYTESEIKEAWEADEGMGYLKQHTDWDSYWGFVQKSTDLFTDSEYNDMTDGNLSGSNWQESPEYMALLEETGIPTQFVNDDGDVFNFNGTTYVKDYKTDDDIGVDVINSVALGLIGGVVAGPLVAGALGPILGPAAAKAASSTIINLASQYMTTGNVDWEDALVSAATSYGGAKLGEVLQGSGSLGGIGDKISGVTDKFTEVLDKTGDIGSAAIKAGGMSLLTQMVTTGEIDVKQAGLAALMAGGTTAFQEWTTSMYDAGAELTSDDLQEIVVEAKRVGTDVGGGMTQLENGLVINDAGQIIGNMDDIDLDGDGMLSSSDLQEITTPPRDLVDPNLNDNVYGDVDLSPPGETTNPTAFTKEWADERYGSFSESQTVAAMQRDGFTNEQIDAYLGGRYDDIDAMNPNIVTHAGGWVENMEQPYTLEYRDGRHYVIMDGKLKAISEDAYTDLYADLNGDGDWQQTMDKYGVTSGGDVFGGYDEYGRPVYNQSATVDDWINLDGSQPPVSAPIDDFVEAEPAEQETVEEVSQDNSSSDATGDPNESVDAGQGTGGGETSASGGAGASGATGGSGTAGGGNNGGAIVIGQAPGTPGGAGSVGSGDPSASTETETEIDPAGGEGVPATPVMNSRIEELMARGMSYEQAVANQNAAISQGADLNEDGMVTNAEWSAHTNVPGSTGEGGSTGGAGTGAGTGGTGGGTSTGGGEGSGGGAGSGAGTGSSGSGSGGSTGTGGGTGAGTGSGTGSGGGVNGGSGGGASGTTGGGEGTTPGVGTGTQPGSGGGAGGGGNGGTGGNGAGMLSGSGGSGRPEWGPLFPGTPFKKFQKRRTGIVQSLFEDLMQ